MLTTKTLFAYLACLLVIIVLDVIWIGFVAKPLYQRGIGHLMAPEPRLAVAMVFYLIFAFGLMYFAVLPNLGAEQLTATLISAALFGLVCYATYDLTNLATLKNWPLSLALIDMAWGVVVSTSAAAAARFIARY